jgi:ribose 5-phosphate isomerase B
MKLAIGSDHAGFKLKGKLLSWLKTADGGKHQVRDLGTYSEVSCDYPDFAQAVAKVVAKKQASKGLLICGTGVGMAIAANKVHGVRAGVAWNAEIAALAADHNNVNVVCFFPRFL